MSWPRYASMHLVGHGDLMFATTTRNLAERFFNDGYMEWLLGSSNYKTSRTRGLTQRWTSRAGFHDLNVFDLKRLL